MFFKRPKQVVYTALFGNYEKLNEQSVSNYKNIDFVCFTDNPHLTSNTWKMVTLDSVGMDISRESRRPKILSHEFLTQYDESLWIDNSIILKADPTYIFSYLHQSKEPFVCIKHPWRNCIYDEAEFVIDLSMDSEKRIRNQMLFYQKENYPQDAGLIAGGFLLRRHHDPRVINCMKQWYYHVLHYSKRDQLSFNFVAWKLKFRYKSLELNLANNSLFDRILQERAPRDFDDATYLWLNSDVKEADVEPRQHYVKHGKKEGRPYRYFQPLKLDKLANRYKLDKGSLYYKRHFYTRVYEYYLHSFRHKPINLLEIGLLNAKQHIEDVEISYSDSSLLMWKDYLSKAKIYGFATDENLSFESERCLIVSGSPGNRNDLTQICDMMSDAPTVIIDNGSQTSHHQQISLGYLFSRLASGGLYFIENLQQSYSLNQEGLLSTLNFLKSLKYTRQIDTPHLDADELNYLMQHIDDIQFYDSFDYTVSLGQDALAVIIKK